MSVRIINGAIVTFADIYEFGGFIFQWHSYLGPIKCKRDGDPSKAREGKKFYSTVDAWRKLPKRKRERYRLKKS